MGSKGKNGPKGWSGNASWHEILSAKIYNFIYWTLLRR